jgi:hypothetical protein
MFVQLEMEIGDMQGRFSNSKAVPAFVCKLADEKHIREKDAVHVDLSSAVLT